MSLVGLLATTSLITALASSMPMIQAAALASPVTADEQRARIPVDHDHFLLILLLNRKDFDMKSKPLHGTDYITEMDSGGGVGGAGDPSSLTRDKRIGSLSIVDSVDVLRQRVLLELARRQAIEDQRMISDNRRFLDSVGKRSDQTFVYRDHRLPRKKHEYKLEPGDNRLERLVVQ